MMRQFVMVALTAVAFGVASRAPAQEATLPTEVAKTLQSFVGEWKAQGTARGVPFEGTWKAEWGPHNCRLKIDYAITAGDEKFNSGGVFGWDPATQQYRILALFNAGTVEDISFTQQSPGKFRGEYAGSAEGKTLSGKCQVTNTGSEWTFQTGEIKLGGEKHPPIKVKSVKQEPARLSYEQLKPFEWLMGKWSADLTIPDDSDAVQYRGETFTFVWSNAWMRNETSIKCVLDVKHSSGETTFSSLDIISWNPITRQIEYSYFNSNGGRGEGVFTRRGRQLVLSLQSISPNTDIGYVQRSYEPLDDESMLMKTNERFVRGEREENYPPLLFRRVQ